MRVNAPPNWEFDINEVSACVYRLTGVHKLGCSIEFMGTDPEELLERANAEASQTEQSLQTWLKSKNQS
jgi:hypothetical protein